MNRLLQPTLVRRVILALMVAFAVIWLVLLGVQFVQATNPAQQDAEVRSFGEILVTDLSATDNLAEARAVVAALEWQLNSSYRRHHVPQVLLIQLRDRQGALVFASKESGDTVLTGEVGKMTEAVLRGETFRVFRGETPQWSVSVGQSKIPDSWVLVAVVLDLSFYMLIAFPLALLPMWIAVSRGLQPLRQLAQHIDARSADDLRPTGLSPRYAELKPVVRSLDALLSQLRTKVARESAFVHEAAHELRTPMAVIATQAHSLVCAEHGDERRQAQQHLEHAIRRAAHLVEQLLQLARIDSDHTAEVEQLDLAQIVQQALAALAPAALAKDMDVSLEAPDHLLCRLDVHAFSSILHNLVGNAILYVQPGGHIVVKLALEGELLTLSVADDGPGIPVDQRMIVFERFFRGNGHDLPGTGLGLAIVKQATAKLAGKVWIEDGLGGKGCRIVVSMPGVG